MAAPRATPTSLTARVFSTRLEVSARGEFLARASRDADLQEIGAAPETLALIGGASVRTPADAAGVALWLWVEAEHAGLNRAASILYNAIVHSRYPAPRDGEASRWHYPARTRAGIALSRQLLSAALDAASTEVPRSAVSAPPPLAAALGEWWASMLEGAGLSEAAAALYRMRSAKESPEASARDTAVLRRATRTAFDSPEPDPQP